jgi:hypothetical protein
MANPVTQVRRVDDHGRAYEALAFVCPGCVLFGGTGLHMLPVRGDTADQPSWDWDGDEDAPTLSPSVLTRYNDDVCHSFIRGGMVEFLSDCTHELAGQTVPLPPLEDWMMR